MRYIVNLGFDTGNGRSSIDIEVNGITLKSNYIVTTGYGRGTRVRYRGKNRVKAFNSYKQCQ